MAKTIRKAFDIDLDSLLTADFLNEDENDNEMLETWKLPKRLKTCIEKTNNKDQQEREKIKKNEDMSEFFQNVGNGVTKSLQVKKNRLTQFTKTISSIYQTKLCEMIKKHEEESENFKKKTMNSINVEIQKFEEEIKKLKQNETKLMKVYEQQIKIIHKTSAVYEEWIQQLLEAHRNFAKEFEQVRNKQKSETLDLTKSINEDIIDMQKNFLADFKNEELQTMRKYFNTFYY